MYIVIYTRYVRRRLPLRRRSKQKAQNKSEKIPRPGSWAGDFCRGKRGAKGERGAAPAAAGGGKGRALGARPLGGEAAGLRPIPRPGRGRPGAKRQIYRILIFAPLRQAGGGAYTNDRFGFLFSTTRDGDSENRDFFMGMEPMGRTKWYFPACCLYFSFLR